MDFLRTLREDIADYGTLPEYTLRRLANLKYEDDKSRGRTGEEIYTIRQELGDDYLIREKARVGGTQKEVIIAIENRKI